MPETREFKPIKEIGTISTSEETEIKFYVDEYRGHRYGSIRTYLKRESYTGPTKAGITLNAPILESLAVLLEKLPKETEVRQDTELGRFPRRAGIELVARITIYRDAPGLDLREFVDDGSYKGWSKKGVRINYTELPTVIKYLKDMHSFLVKAAA